MEHRRREAGLPLHGVWLETLTIFARFFGIPALVTWLFVSLSPYSHHAPRGPLGVARSQIGSFKTAVEVYRLDHGGKAPTTRQGLLALLRPPALGTDARWKGPYLTSIPLDPWGHPYVYKSPGPNGEPYLVLCYGADGRAGGISEAEDLSNIKR